MKVTDNGDIVHSVMIKWWHGHTMKVHYACVNST